MWLRNVVTGGGRPSSEDTRSELDLLLLLSNVELVLSRVDELREVLPLDELAAKSGALSAELRALRERRSYLVKLGLKSPSRIPRRLQYCDTEPSQFMTLACKGSRTHVRDLDPVALDVAAVDAHVDERPFEDLGVDESVHRLLERLVLGPRLSGVGLEERSGLVDSAHERSGLLGLTGEERLVGDVDCQTGQSRSLRAGTE